MPALQPPKNGTLVHLRNIIAEDAPKIAALAGDRRVSAPPTNIPHPNSLQHSQDFIALTAASREADTGHHRAMVATSTGGLVGAVGLEVSLRDATAHLSYWVGVGYWGHGFASEAASLVVGWAPSLGIVKFAARCLSANHDSMRVL